MSFCLIILAAGNSHRFRSNIGKPYQKIAGKSLIQINIDKALKFKQIKKIILVYNKKDLKRVKSLKLKNIKLLPGGKTRQQSTFIALKYLIKHNGFAKVLIHDVARPNFSIKLLGTILKKIKNSRAVVPKIKVQDAINNLTQSKTTIISAHRLSTINKVDKILVIKDGELIEEGSHRSLIDNSIMYKKLYEQQQLL